MTGELADLLRRAAVFIEDGSEYEGLCADCGMTENTWPDSVPPGEHHSPDCIVRTLRERAGPSPRREEP